ncbi:MAG: cytochrome c [Vulcanimicrobiaceae bacterium]
MSLVAWLALAVAVGAAFAGCARDADRGRAAPRIGTLVDAATIATLDTDVTPDGHGLPAGAGTAARGAAVYEARCAQCHESPVVPALWGGIGSLHRIPPQKSVGSYWPYATTIYDYIARAMPPGAPQPLPPGDVYAVTAYILAQNGIVRRDAPVDATTLPKVAMPNRDGFETMGSTPAP